MVLGSCIYSLIMDNTFVNIFNGVTDVNTSNKLSVLDVIWHISEGKWRYDIDKYRSEKDELKKVELKKRLPAVTFSGTINGRRRMDSNITEYSGIVVCDIDKIGTGVLARYKNRLISDSNVLAFFESPSRGLKVLFKVDSELKYHKSNAFPYLKEYMFKRHDITIDPSGSNPSRLCFMSYDPKMYFNEDANVVAIDISENYDDMKSVRKISNNFTPSNDIRHVFDTCVKWTKKSKVGSYHKGNRNKYVFYLTCLLCEAGMSEDVTLSMISNRYSSLGIKEIKTTIRSGYKKCSSKFGSRPIYKKKSNQTDLF